MQTDGNALASKTQTGIRTYAPGSATRRSRLTNQRWMLPGVDGRSSAARRFRDLCESYAAEAGGDLSATDVAQIRQAATLMMRAERMQSAEALHVHPPQPANDDELIRISSEVRRILAPIIAKRVDRKTTDQPSLEEHIARRRAERETPQAA